MNCLTTERIEDLNSDLTATLAQILAIDSALAGPLLTGGTKSYKFDSGTGVSQQVFEDPMKLLRMREIASAKRDKIRRDINGKSITRIQLRR